MSKKKLKKSKGIEVKDEGKIKNIDTSKQSPAALIQMAVSEGVDLEKLEKVLTLQERWESNQAKKAYHKAMAEFKANPPKINKDRTVGYSGKSGSKVGYKHASLANVTEKINEAMSKYGLSASWSTKQNGSVQVTCKITHVMGHSESTTLTAPADDSGSKNKIQAIGSTITYLERYTLLALTGLATYDQDDDAQSASKAGEVIDKKQLKKLKALIDDLEVEESMFLEYMKIEKLKDMPKSEFQKAITALEAKRKKEGTKK